MIKRIILVTGVGGDVGQSVIKCLKGSALNFVLIGCDADHYAAGRKYVDKFFLSPWVKHEMEYLGFINRLIDAFKIKYIFPTTEFEIKFYDKYREQFSDKGVFIFINNPEIIRIFFDKYETVKFLKQNNLPYPKTYLLEEYKNELSWPVILKPRREYGGRGIIMINNEEELCFFKKRVEDSVVQELIGSLDEEYTASLFSDSTKLYSIVFKRQLGYGSMTKIAELVINKEIKNMVEKIAAACSLSGVLNVQLRKTNRGYIPFEINPRFSSTVFLRHYFGFQDVKWWIDSKENRKIEFKLKYRKGVGVRCIDECFFDLVKNEQDY